MAKFTLRAGKLDFNVLIRFNLFAFVYIHVCKSPMSV